MKYINSNLISLKCVLFLFFGGIGCLLPFLPLHMVITGLSLDELRIVSIVSPCIALLGPAIAGPLADKLAGNSVSTRSKTGKYLRIMIAGCLILSAVFYWLLMAVPKIVRTPPIVEQYLFDPVGSNIVQERRCVDEKTCDAWKNNVKDQNPPATYFMCDRNGGQLLQEKTCKNEEACYKWESEELKSLYLNHCSFMCKNDFFNLTKIDDGDYSEQALVEPSPDTIPKESHPHVCYWNEEHKSVACEAFSHYSRPVEFKIKLGKFPDDEGAENSTGESMCRYNVANALHCRMSEELQKSLTDSQENCEPVVRCKVNQKYNFSAMQVVLVEPDCSHENPELSFWLYLLIRSLADIFPAAAVALLDAAIIIATRETSTGRGDVGKQFAAGALGFAIFAPICGAIADPLVALVMFSVLLVLGALIMLFDSTMPLSPAEWWWHTRCGLLAMPLSSIRKYSLETAALAVVLILLGIFWNGMDPYLPWYIIRMEEGSSLMIGLAITVGALPAVIFLFYAEKIVDYCGHSNILIFAFTLYIIHYTGLSFIDSAGCLLVVEALEIFTLHFMWVTVVCYLRHLVPRRFIASGQALAVIAHFCIGRCLGALIGGIAYTGSRDTFITVQQYFAIVAAVIATVYYLLYHLYLKPRCAAPVTDPPRPEPALIQSMNGNGSYTPLRVYHNGKAKKGQFRY